MACQTGIRADDHLLKFFSQCKLGKIRLAKIVVRNADDHLLKFFSQCKLGKIRLAKIVVRNEQLCVNYEDKGSTDWRADWKKSLPECVDSFEPCFILFRLDAPSDWLLIRLVYITFASQTFKSFESVHKPIFYSPLLLPVAVGLFLKAISEKCKIGEISAERICSLIVSFWWVVTHAFSS
ncbi:Twinfilin-2 [Toxocara canis]|uniref:Twinfilin-2 n=1 Tax=Toxocara canis TaxID=6265 RepID=A0A0B2W6Z8_TOXCA|nr:Twinfilin-2 [Toxocara canis]